MGQDGLLLRGKNEVRADKGVVEGLDAIAIPGEEESLPAEGEEGKKKLTPWMDP